ncbi:MAG TPA: hypothetical protein VKA09_04875 [Nitrososphaeraceae archaeon]|nr:hypothetical protein [Nitrososphaeraceae archaeon]
MSFDIEATNTGLLTRREVEWLLGKTPGISKSFEYKIKSSLRKKVQAFVEIELPLLLEKGLFPVANNNFPPQKNTIGNLSLGKAKVPGPNPGQGLPFFAKEAGNEGLFKYKA